MACEGGEFEKGWSGIDEFFYSFANDEFTCLMKFVENFFVELLCGVSEDVSEVGVELVHERFVVEEGGVLVVKGVV